MSRELRVSPGTPGMVALLESILEDSPQLRGAKCTAQPRLFDPDVRHDELGFISRQARTRAVENCCLSCPARGQCWEWASTARGRVSGPTAATANVASALSPRRRRELSGERDLVGGHGVADRQHAPVIELGDDVRDVGPADESDDAVVFRVASVENHVGNSGRRSMDRGE